MPPLPRPKRPVAPRAQVMTFPAPTGGLNTVSPGGAIPPTDCVVAWNVIPSEGGLRGRLGYAVWCTGLTGATDNKVRTLMSFSGSDPSQHKLFATTDTKIWNVSTSTETPTSALTFSTNLGNSGYGVFRVVVTPAGHFGLYCDEVNGLHVYSQSGNTWAAVEMGGGASQIDNVDPGDLVHATVFKKRVWFTERNSASAWYLSANAIYGSATEFSFATHFRMGGHLVGLYNWTYDGGAGIDDSLVAVSSAGDVVVINGTDPADPTTFNVRGVWSIGTPPVGRDIALEIGGDLWLLSATGIIPLSRLVVGANKAFETAKISNLFNQLMLTRANLRGWSMRLHPEDNALLVLYPDYSTEADQQLAQSQSTKGWFRYKDMPMHCAAVWEGRLHFGTQDGRVCVSKGYVDEVPIDGTSDFESIDCTVIPAFQRAGGGNMAVNQIRALFLTDGDPPDVALAARYDLDQSDLQTPIEAAGTGSLWGSMVWGEDPWGGSSSNVSVLRGATGSGHLAAAAIRFQPIARTTLVQLEATFLTGGFL